MVLRDLHQIFESWAPTAVAWERDNVGLQCGSMGQPVRRILVSLDLTDNVISEAKRKNIDLIITHHPLLFHPLKSVNEDHRVGRLVSQLVRNRIAVYAAHTNLDFTSGGVNHTLAAELGVGEVEFLERDQHNLKKLVVFVPRDYSDKVMQAMAAAGAGHVGKYGEC